MLNILTSVLDFGMPLPTAVESPRFSHKWFPDWITFETPERYPELVNALKAMGHTIERTGPLPQADAHSIWVGKPGNFLGVADRRRNSQSSVSGY